jgi:hypothetical protein
MIGPELIHPRSAVRRDDFQVFWLNGDQPGHKIASPGFQVAKDPNLVFEAFPRLVTPKRLMDAAIITDPD